MFHPKLPGVAFLGMYRGPYFGVIELQARWATMAFQDSKYHPSKEEMEAGIKEEQGIRDMSPRPQFPHGNYVEIVDEIAKRIGVFPTQLLENNDLSQSDDGKMLKELPIIPPCFRIEGPHSKPDIALPVVRECYEFLN